jgi:solute carrier family 25 oxoglutarate transporter 11
MIEAGPFLLFTMRLLVGLISGAIASFMSCPVEVCLVRMQADGRLPPASRRNYHGVFDALVRIAREEGVTTYWRGGSTTVLRAMVVSVSQITAYDQAKAAMGTYLQDVPLHIASGLFAAFTFTGISMPFDTVKTRAQNAKTKTSSNTFAAIGEIARAEGISSLWNGYGPYLASKGALTVLLFIIKEQYEQIAAKMISSCKAAGV